MSQLREVGLAALVFLFCSVANAQQVTATGQSGNRVVPAWMNFSGVLTGFDGKPLTGTRGVTFYLYKDAQGTVPLWMETQNVQLDKTGRYKVMLGSSSSEGLPADIFASGEARWLGVQAQGQKEQARVMLLAVPYALKAVDAETVGGKPASAFMPARATRNSNTANSYVPSLSGTGKKNFVPLWLTSTKLGDSNLFQNPVGDLGLGTTAPAATLDIRGTEDVRNTLTLFPNGSSPTLSVSGTVFSVNHAGLVSFVSGQTFPGTGTITGVKAGTDLTGGGTSGNITLNLDTSRVPQLNAANSFTGNQSVNGSVNTSGNISSGGSVSATGAGLGGFMGDVGCSAPTIGIQATSLTANCQNFIVGFDSSQNSTYINRPAGGALHFREGNVNDQITIASGGLVGIGTQSPSATLEVDGLANGGFVAGSFVGNASANGGPQSGVAGTGGSDGAGGEFGAGCNDTFCGDGIDVEAPVTCCNYAGSFVGDLNVTGTIYAGTKDFKIDHPLDPANKYLYHASVESSEMKNIYDGIAVLDVNGSATVQLPQWFESLNGDFRYQLTCIGGFAPVFIAQEITNNQFTIAGGKAGMKVSWLVTGVRHDAYAQAHPLDVEAAKSQKERGYYIHPELYGAPAERSIDWARTPAFMKRVRHLPGEGLKRPRAGMMPELSRQTKTFVTTK